MGSLSHTYHIPSFYVSNFLTVAAYRIFLINRTVVTTQCKVPVPPKTSILHAFLFSRLPQIFASNCTKLPHDFGGAGGGGGGAPKE